MILACRSLSSSLKFHDNSFQVFFGISKSDETFFLQKEKGHQFHSFSIQCLCGKSDFLLMEEEKRGEEREEEGRGEERGEKRRREEERGEERRGEERRGEERRGEEKTEEERRGGEKRKGERR